MMFPETLSVTKLFVIQAGLFSASITAFIIESYKKLQPDSGAMTVTLLTQISQQLAATANSSPINVLPSTNSFQPTSSVLRVNAFWFLSLCFSLTCALAATLVEEWAREYLQAIDRRPSPHNKGEHLLEIQSIKTYELQVAARIRSFLYEGLERFGMRRVVQAIPTLLHIAVFLFLGGLVDFLVPINHIIAYTVLGIVIPIASAYIAITFLPIIRYDCPYRTPLSKICWAVLRTMGLLRYVDPAGKYRRISVSMMQGREMFAIQNAAGLLKRDLRALRWTIKSLTEDIELEPFIEGVTEALSAPKRSKSLRTMSMAMRHLLFDEEATLLDRIIKLLTTCHEPSGLAKGPRRKRAIICMNAIALLFEVSVVGDSRLYLSVLAMDSGQRLGRAVTTLQNDNDPTIVSVANSTVKTIVTRLQTDIAAVIENSDHESRSSAWSLDASLVLLNVLNHLDSIESIFDIIPNMTRQWKSSSPQSVHYKEFVRVLCDDLIPDRLVRYSDLGAIAPEDRKRCTMTCLKATYVTACYFPCQPSNMEAIASTVGALVKLKYDKVPAIAIYANCTAARMACHFQSDIVLSLSNPSGRDTAHKQLSNSFAALYGLDILGNLAQHPAHHVLQQQLGLGFDRSPPEPNRHGLRQPSYDHLINFLEQQHERSMQYSGDIPASELQLLKHLQLRTTTGITILDFPGWGKLILSRSHIVVLVALLQSMVASPLPDEALELTLDTFQFLATGLNARFATHGTQNILVDVASKVVHTLRGDLNRAISQGIEDPLQGKIIQVLFEMLGTVTVPDAIAVAREIIAEVYDDSSIASEEILKAAADTFIKVQVPILYHRICH